MVGQSPAKGGQIKTEPSLQDNSGMKDDTQEQPHNAGNQKNQRGGGDFRNRNNKPFRGGFNKRNNENKGQVNQPSSSNVSENQQSEEGSTDRPALKKFTGRCRLFVGNLPMDFSEEDFTNLFQPFGEFSEAYVNGGRGFGFIRMDFRHNAEAAKAALDGSTQKGRTLRVRFATHGAALKVKNLHPAVSNELLEQGFTLFGEIERAIVIVDDRGKSTGEGIVEFVRKPGAQQAIRRINEGVFLLGASPRPLVVETLEQKDDEDGMPEKYINKSDQYKKERESEPRFAQPGTFEYDMGMRWKQLIHLEKEKQERVKKEMEEAQIKLEDEMQSALYDYQAEQIRQDLLRQQEELRRLEERKQQDMMRRRQEMEMRTRDEERIRQEEERRRQEMMRQQSMGAGRGRRMADSNRDDGMNGRGQGGAPPMQPPPIPPGLNRGGQQMGPRGQGPSSGPPGGSVNQMRQTRFDQPSANFEGGMGGPPGPRGSMFPGSMGGGPGGPDRGMMDRRREGAPSEEYGEMKRMRRF